jgi:hypothetical protein
VAFNPIRTQKHLKGIGHPTGREDLASTTGSAGAPEDPARRPWNPPEGACAGPGGPQGARRES